MNRITRLVLAGTALAATATLYLIPGDDWAGAQTAPVVAPPTVPCPGCGGNPSARGDGTTVWAWPDHHCDDMGQSSYSVTVGVGRNAPGSVTFEWRNADPGTGSGAWYPLATVQPGRQTTVYPVVVVEPGQTVVILVRATSQAGTPFASGGTTRTFPLTCPCDQPPATSSPPSSAVTTAPPVTTAPASTEPGTPTTGVSSVPGSTQPFRLPDTGVDAGPVLWAGLALVATGALAGGVARRERGR